MHQILLVNHHRTAYDIILSVSFLGFKYPTLWNSTFFLDVPRHTAHF